MHTSQLADVAAVLRLGREAVLRTLLEARRLVQGREHGYLLHRVYLDDYCIWVRHNHVHAGWTTCRHDVYAACISRVYLMYISCVSRACLMCISCTPHRRLSPAAETVLCVVQPRWHRPMTRTTATSAQVQQLSAERLTKLADRLEGFTPQQQAVGFSLPTYEELAEEEEEDDDDDDEEDEDSDDDSDDGADGDDGEERSMKDAGEAPGTTVGGAIGARAGIQVVGEEEVRRSKEDEGNLV